MKSVRVLLHSFALAVADIAGIGGGAVIAFHVSGASNQFWLQVPIAIILSVAGFLLWRLLLRSFGFQRLQLVNTQELWVCLLASLLWSPVVFLPLHYFTQGYLSGVGNLVALALYQLPVNALALFGPFILRQPVP